MLKYFSFLFILIALVCEGKLPDITAQDVTLKTQEMMKFHASHKDLNPSLTKRILQNYVENLDFNKTYFIESDISEWLNPSEELLEKIIVDYKNSRFPVFENIQEKFISVIERRRELDKKIDDANLPASIRAEEFKEMPWAKSEEELLNRLKRIRALQIETAKKLNDDMREKSMQRIAKRQTKYEEDMKVSNVREKECLIFSYVLKATASAFDSHTVYFTPGEANRFMIHVQQKFYGIGAQLRDDINGFSIIKIIEGGPSSLNKELKEKDRIVAVNGEPVVGMDIVEAVELIQGEVNTPVILTVIRETKQADGSSQEEKLDITIVRGEVILKEARYKSAYEPYGEGAIGYLKLNSFYQDKGSSSASDLEQEIERLKRDHQLEGLILDLRYNSGGLLSQAVAVSGLFIKKGIVVSVKDENQKIQHLRNAINNKVWDGPLIVLVNRMSASASEIVAQTLQDYGRALIVGDDHTFGKGSYQTFTLNTEAEHVNPQGEFKVTRGRYYTPSGKTPQLKGALSDVQIPGPLCESEVGECFSKHPLENDTIAAHFDDDLSDVSIFQRDKIRRMYQFDLQEKEDRYVAYLETLKTNSSKRIENSLNYQNMLKEVRKKDKENEDECENFGQIDLQLEEAYNVMKDLILLTKENDPVSFEEDDVNEAI